MPIGLILATEVLEAPLLQQASRIALAFTMIGRAARRRMDALEAVAERVRGFPVWAFHDRALSVEVHPRQRRALRAYESVGQAFAAPFVAFGRGVAGFVQDIRDDLALPRLLGHVRNLFDNILAAIDRVERAGPRLFDIGRARFTDIIGVAAWVGRSLNGSWGFIGRVLQGAREAFATREAAPAQTPTTRREEPGPLAERLSDAGRWLTGGLIALPLVPRIIRTLVQAAWLRARDVILDTLQAVEARVFRLRRSVLGWVFNRLPKILAPVPILTALASAMVVEYVKFWAEFGERYMVKLFAELRRFFTQLQAFFNAWIDAINTFQRVLDRIINFDILRFIFDKTGLLPIYRRLGIRPPSLTLGDILDATGTVARVGVGAGLQAAIATARSLIPTSLFPDADRKLRLLSQVIADLFQAPRPYPDERPGPPPHVPAMPNFYDTLIGRPAAELTRVFRAWGTQTATRVEGVFQDLGRAFDVYARDMVRLSAAAARVVPASRIERFAGEARGLSDALFGPQLRDLRAAVARVRRPSGSGFQHWLITGGFDVIGAAIPAYVREMRDFWRSQQEGAGDAPVDLGTAVSPHILARRARLARVRMRTLTLDAGDRPLDPDLAREVAQRFRGAVQDAYGEGQRAMRAAAAG